MIVVLRFICFFFFNDTATTEIYTLSLHDALPISSWTSSRASGASLSTDDVAFVPWPSSASRMHTFGRSEEHTSELQSRQYLVCRLLLEKKKNTMTTFPCFFDSPARSSCCHSHFPS